MSDQIWWYVTRSASIVAWIAAAASVLIGLLTSSRLLGRRPTIPWLTDIHRSLSGIAVTFVAIHMVSLWLDGFVDFGPAELLIPWVAEVPGLSATGIAFGVIAAWLIFAVEATSLVKDHMSKRAWHGIHLSSYLVLALGTVHALLIGSDVANPILASIGISLLTAVFIVGVIRVDRVQRTVTVEQSTDSPASPDDSPAPSDPPDPPASPTVPPTPTGAAPWGGIPQLDVDRGRPGDVTTPQPGWFPPVRLESDDDPVADRAMGPPADPAIDPAPDRAMGPPADRDVRSRRLPPPPARPARPAAPAPSDQGSPSRRPPPPAPRRIDPRSGADPMPPPPSRPRDR